MRIPAEPISAIKQPYRIPRMPVRSTPTPSTAARSELDRPYRSSAFPPSLPGLSRPGTKQGEGVPLSPTCVLLRRMGLGGRDGRVVQGRSAASSASLRQVCRLFLPPCAGCRSFRPSQPTGNRRDLSGEATAPEHAKRPHSQPQRLDSAGMRPGEV